MPAICAVPVTVVLHQQSAEQSMLQWFSGQSGGDKKWSNNILQIVKYSRLSLSRSRRDNHKHFEISVLRHIRFVILRKKQFEQRNFTNDYVI